MEDGKGRLLVERRPATGMWASMFQAQALEDGADSRGRRWKSGSECAGLELVEEFAHGTTHRDVRFGVWRAAKYNATLRAMTQTTRNARFMSRVEIAGLGLSNPQRKMLLAQKSLQIAGMFSIVSSKPHSGQARLTQPRRLYLQAGHGKSSPARNAQDSARHIATGL